MVLCVRCEITFTVFSGNSCSVGFVLMKLNEEKRDDNTINKQKMIRNFKFEI